jgi:hypothetical protein
LAIQAGALNSSGSVTTTSPLNRSNTAAIPPTPGPPTSFLIATTCGIESTICSSRETENPAACSRPKFHWSIAKMITPRFAASATALVKARTSSVLDGLKYSG